MFQGVRVLTDAEIEQSISAIMELFRFLANKDCFERWVASISSYSLEQGTVRSYERLKLISIFLVKLEQSLLDTVCLATTNVSWLEDCWTNAVFLMM